MHRFFIKTPWVMRALFANYIWKMPVSDQSVFLTFDDGPHPEVTPWVLDLLKHYEASASFFCIGKNVQQYPAIYQRIIDEGHAVGNHTHNHLNGWKTDEKNYTENISEAAQYIQSNLFRPPYGRIKKAQVNHLSAAMKVEHAKVIMWDVLTADFDKNLSWEKCFGYVKKYTGKGSVIVFHDSEKAFGNLKELLPESLKYLKKEGYIFRKIVL